MDSQDIRNQAQLMAKDIKNIVEYYNKLDPDFSFYPVITMTETSTSEGVFKGISVEVEASYNTRQGAKEPRQFTQVDTSANAFMEGSLTPRESFKATIIGDRIKPYDV